MTPALIERLTDDSAAVRAEALAALKKLSKGEDFGPKANATADAAARGAAEVAEVVGRAVAEVRGGDMKERLAGVLMLLIGAVFGYLCVYSPLEARVAGRPDRLLFAQGRDPLPPLVVLGLI